jgi:hypothetical protein
MSGEHTRIQLIVDWPVPNIELILDWPVPNIELATIASVERYPDGQEPA